MPRRALAALLGLGVVALTAFACDRFGDNPAPDGVPEASSRLDAGDASLDADTPACGPVVPLDEKKDDLLLSTPASDEEVTTFGLVSDDAFVWWLEQARTKGLKTNIYDGDGTSRLRRVLVEGDKTVETLADDLGRAVFLVRVEKSLFYITRHDTKTELMRVAADCSTPCTPVSLWAAEGVVPSRLLASGPTSLVMIGSNGSLHTFDGIFQDTVRHVDRGATAGYPGLVAVFPMAYASSFDRDHVFAFDTQSALAVAAPSIAFPPIDAGDPIGANFLEHHCGVLYARRGDNWFWRAPVGGTTFERWRPPAPDAAPPGVLFKDVYDVRADDDYLYVATANFGGVSAIARDTGAQVVLYRGNVFALGVSPKAVFWGEHDVNGRPTESGTVHYRFKY